MSARLLAAASRADDYFAGRLGACVPLGTLSEILAELSAAVAETKASPAHPDTVRLDWLGLHMSSGYTGGVAPDQVRTLGLRAAIDAQRSATAVEAAA